MSETERYSLVKPDIFEGKKIRVELLGETPDTVVKTYTLYSLKDVKLYLAIKNSRHIEQTMLPRKSRIYDHEIIKDHGIEGLRELNEYHPYLHEEINEKIDYKDYDFVEYAGEKNGEILNTIRDSIHSWCRNSIECFFPRIFMIGKINKDEIKKDEDPSVSEIHSLIEQLNSLLEEECCLMPVYSMDEVAELIK
jgi:hypothetical protein